MTDPDAQPFVWVSKWVDYSDKYGFGYQLSDDGVGVMYNDGTRLIMLANNFNIHYIDRMGEEVYYTVKDYPRNLEKKMKLLNFFLRYMNDHLMKAGGAVAVKQSDSLARPPYMHQWFRTQTAVVMLLTNGSLQVCVDEFQISSDCYCDVNTYNSSYFRLTSKITQRSYYVL